MEETKLLITELMNQREIIGGIITKHNDLANAHVKLQKKHNKLCVSFEGLCLVCLGLDLLILWNAYDISKLKRELKEKEKKEG